jgi:GAF domain-containing protein
MQRRRGSGQSSKGQSTIGPGARKLSASTSLQQKIDSLTDELNEEREQRKAAADLLNVISRSGFDLQTVLDTLVESATRLCEADHAWLFQRNGDVFRWLASFGHATEVHSRIRKHFDNHVISVDRGSVVGRAALEARVINISDVLADPDYKYGDAQKIGGYRSVLGVPLWSKGGVVGAIFVGKIVPQPFTQKQIETVTNFAAQAVIAIDNTQLLTDLRESLARQTATSELLQVITSSPGNLTPVFNKMLENASRICEANFGTLVLEEAASEGSFRVVAMHNAPPEWAEKRTREPVFKPGPLNNVAIVKRSGQAQHIPDLRLDRSYLEGEPAAVAIANVGGARTLAVVPLLKENDVIGVFGMYRQEVRPFTDAQMHLLADFAAQAVIAIENARLLSELNTLNQKLEQRVAEQVNEIERMSKLRRFLPPQVADLIVASGAEKQLESHRREITALFCDLRGFTGFSESADPEDVMSLT